MTYKRVRKLSPFKLATNAFQRKLIVDTLRKTKSIEDTGQQLGISAGSVRRFIREWGIKIKTKVIVG